MAFMGVLPSGTVSLLFSDMEGSTSLVRRLGDVWPRVLDAQREACRSAWSAHGGHEMGTEGDSFFVAFPTAEAAVAAAVAAQRGLVAAEWPGGESVRVRMGIHTGTPRLHDQGYVGMDVHRAARIAAAAHGGQVVISAATAELVGNLLPVGVGLRGLGAHQLKDIPERVHLSQVCIDGLPDRFPALRTLSGTGSLPTSLTPLLGRAGEVAELVDLITDDETRLVTLTGPGGTGKTRLATTVAARVAQAFTDGAHFVPLAPVRTAEEMWPAIAQVLDVPAEGQIPPGFFDYVAHRTFLVVLDNLEQIPAAGEVVGQLLAAAPHLRVIATSRRPLHVTGEFEHQVPPLLLPAGDTVAEVEGSGAGRMFLEHARRVRTGFTVTPDNAADIAVLCRGLDGLPLSIELAAARVKVLTPRAILTRLDQVLDLKAADSTRPDRHRTIRGAIAWSFDLLTLVQQHVLSRLGVFVGGADLDAVRAVTHSDTLAGADVLEVLFDLVEASLVTVTDTADGEPRFGLLESVRLFALDQLTTYGQADIAYVAHAQHYYQLSVYDWAGYTDFNLGRAMFLRELDNFRAVLSRGAPGIRDPEHYPHGITVPPLHTRAMLCGLALAAAQWHQTVAWAGESFSRSNAETDHLGVAACVSRQADAYSMLGDNASAIEHAMRSLDLARQVIAESTSVHVPSFPWVDPRLTVSRSLRVLSEAHLNLENFKEARHFADELLSVAPPEHKGMAFGNAYALECASGNYQGALDVLERMLAVFGPQDQYELAWRQTRIADVEMQMGDVTAAQRRLVRVIESVIEQRDPYFIADTAEMAARLIGNSHPRLCARITGAVALFRTVEATPQQTHESQALERDLTTIRALLPVGEWEGAYELGRSEDLFDLIREAAAVMTSA